MSYAYDGYRSMLESFRYIDLQNLLATFHQNKTGRKSQLQERAINLLRGRSTGINYQAYLSKILEIYRSKRNGAPDNDFIRKVMQNQQPMTSIGMQQAQQQQGIYLPPQYPQQPMQITQAGLPQMQRDIIGNNIAGCSNIQHGHQQYGPHNMVSQVPTSQQLRKEIPSGSKAFDKNAALSPRSSFIPTVEMLANIKFKKLPFYEINSDIMKPITLIGQEICSLQNAPIGMKEEVSKVTLLSNQVTFISKNRNLSGEKHEYIYQVQIRIGLLEEKSTVITDCLPFGLHIRVNGTLCPLPPVPPSARPGKAARRIPWPINCTRLFKLNPNLFNQISVNWNPDGKVYVMAIHLVKILSSYTLLEKLLDKETRSSEDTKNNIIKTSANVDPDFATTSFRFSLVCPLSKVRMKIPAKSVNCMHLQCFDVITFILMNEKKPTWMCPTCNKSCLYDDIQIEKYFLDIVTNSTLTDDCKEIEILADGTWRAYNESNGPKIMENASSTKETPIEYITLDDSDDSNDDYPTVVKKESEVDERLNGPETEALNFGYVDLTLSDNDDNESPKEENITQATDAVNFEAEAEVQPQQAVTSSGQEMVIEIDTINLLQVPRP